MRVAIVVHRFPQLSETFIINQITALIDAGVDVQIFSYYKPDLSQKFHPQFKAYKLHEKVHYGVPLPVNRIKKYANFFRHLLNGYSKHKSSPVYNTLNFYKFGKEVLNLQYFYRALLFTHQNEFDIIHCHFGPIGHDVVQLRRMGVLKGTIVTSFHGYDFLKRSILAQYSNYEIMFRYGDGFIANSTFTYNSLRKLGCESTKIEIIPVSFSNRIFLNHEIEKETNSKFTVLSIARLEEKKGIEYGIKAAYAVYQILGPKFTYSIIGTGSLLNSLKEIVKDLASNEIIKFHGAKTQEEVLNYLYKANVFLLPSITANDGDAETQGLVLLEAQAAGVPVIASRTGGVPDSLIDGETGILVPEKDVDAIASAIIKLYNEPTTSGEMGARGRAFVKENFDQEALCTKMISFYNKLLKANSAHS